MAKKLQSQVDELQSQLNSQKHAIVNSFRPAMPQPKRASA